MNKQLVLILICTCFACNISTAQVAFIKDSTVTMAAGQQYKASNWKQFWWGKHYRKEWLSPVDFPVIDLDATAGGLTPIKRGGGHETKSLRLLGKNGKEYVLRTMDKRLDVLVPEDFRGTFINDLINDQVSTAHPYGPIAVAKLSEAAGIYHTNPVIVFVPKNTRLQAFENDFANKLCLFEERPSGDGWENTALTGYADDVVNTEQLLQKLQADNDKKVDQKAFLKVRLFDMWINDWDRHEDQWVWAVHKQDGKTIYTAFARDRDQSFSKTDGINLYLLSRPWVLPSLQNMDGKLSNIIGTTLAARYLDKQFLNELTKADWQAVVASLQTSLTDKAIEEGVENLPDTIFKTSGYFLIERLKARRDDMLRYAFSYYNIMNKQVDIIGTDKREYFTISKKSTTETEITVQKLKGDVPSDTIYHKIFNQQETKRVYLYGLDDNDVFYTTGTASNNIKITIIGGNGNDGYEVHKSITANNKIAVYDNPENSNTTTTKYKTHFTGDTLFNNYNRTHFKYDWYAPLIIPGFNADDGVLIGGGLIYKKQAWGKTPYAWQQIFTASVSLKTGAPSFAYNGRFKQIFGKWDLELSAAYKGPLFVFNFYGLGNGTQLLTDDRAYNRVRVSQFVFNPKIAKDFGNQELKIGAIAEYLKVAENAGKFIGTPTANIDKNVFYSNTFIGANVQYGVSKRDNELYPTKGYQFVTAAVYKANITTGNQDFTNISASFSCYLPIGKLVLAHRTGVSTNTGNYNFYHANTLGGLSNLRGYYRTRFYGKTSLYQNTELRYSFANVKGYILRGKLGVYGFFDDGRVWDDKDVSEKINIGYGAGFYFLPFNAAALNIAFASSKEVNVLQFGLDFFF